MNFYNNIINMNNNNYFAIDSFKIMVHDTIKDVFPKLNENDVDYLNNVTIQLIENIARKNNFEPTNFFYKQFKQNNKRDIKAIILLLLPFVDDKNNYQLYKKIKDLNQLLHNDIGKEYIQNEILKYPMNDVLKDYFEYSNFSLELIDKSSSELLRLVNNNKKLIYDIIQTNFESLVETLKKINGKMYINWVNITPINIRNYKDKYIYRKTREEYDNNMNNLNDFNGDGLWFGDFYNVFRKGYYENVKKVKWLLFNIDEKYYIQILDMYLNNGGSLDENINIMIDEANPYFLKMFLVYFVNNSSKKRVFMNDKLKPFVLNTDHEGKEDDFKRTDMEKINNLSHEQVVDGLRSIDSDYINDYFSESFDYFMSTPYSKYFINDGIINQDFFYLNETKMNLKNLYNIAKTLSYRESDWTLLGENYSSLSEQDKTEFWTKFNDSTINWIRLNSNIRRQSSTEISMSQIQTILNDINTGWQSLKFDLVFEYLVFNGLLTEFRPDVDITNREYLSNDTNERFIQVKNLLHEKFKNNMDDYLNSYSFLTNEKFKEMGQDKIETLTNGTFEEMGDCFETLLADHYWYTFYAMDWITQISFFNKYIYKQVLLVTGSTGQGKSTQVPKLLLYALKMLDYKNNGKIICTQPRVAPTTNNAERISEELGVPIIQKIEENYKRKTDNYFVEFKYKSDSHMKETDSYLQLKVVTDGTLLQELSNNIIMKKQYFSKLKQDFVYSPENKYDIIIIDEAHEHNANMDVILSLMRNTCYYNNSIRLVIVSATMNDDEPIYRSYYRDIDDKLLFPIKKENINPLYIDRRFHISPFGETTQYTISEVYHDMSESHDNNTNSNYAQMKSYQVVNDICRQSSKGEILLFLTGSGEINEAVKYLNEILPSGNIALPYFSELNKKYKDIIEKIDKEIENIKNYRENIYKEWTNTYVEDKKVPKGLYKRAIIVATNVAEASITLPSLKYVVDTGYAKEAVYDYDIGTSSLVIEKISESSRVQRKGRVGRSSDGEVHFIYSKGARENIRSKYKITQQDISGTILGLSSSDNKYEFYDIHIDPHVNVEYKENTWSEKVGIKQIIDKQFSTRLDKTSRPRYFDMLHDGFEPSYLFDLNGELYIIHPFETKIKRNILLKPINKVQLDWYTSVLFNLQLSLSIVDFGELGTLKNNDSLELRKTVLSEKISDLRDITFSSFNNSQVLLLASSADLLDEVLLILSLLEVSAYNPSNLVLKRKNFDKLKKVYYSDTSDIDSYYRISQHIKNIFKNSIFFNLDRDRINILKEEYRELIRKFKRTPDDKKLRPYYDLFRNLDDNGTLSTQNGFLLWLNNNDNIANIYEREMKKYNLEVQRFCLVTNINYDIVVNFALSYFLSRINIITMKRKDDPLIGSSNVLEWATGLSSNFNLLFGGLSKTQKINQCFIFGYGGNLAIRKDWGFKMYGNIPVELNENTFVKNISNVVFFLSKSKRDTIIKTSILISLPMKHIIQSNPLVYNPINFKKIIYIRKNKTHQIKEMKEWDDFLFNVGQYCNINRIFWNHPDLPVLKDFIRETKKRLKDIS